MLAGWLYVLGRLRTIVDKESGYSGFGKAVELFIGGHEVDLFNRGEFGLDVVQWEEKLFGT